MEKFHIWDVVSVLGLPQAPAGRSSYYIFCPCCDSKPGSKHLNINLRKEVFRCPKCGVSGGIFDLYALYTGVSRSDVRKEMLDRMGRTEMQHIRKKKVEIKEVKESAVADIETRDRTYQALLSCFSLTQEHKENLLGRGLTEEEIEKYGYRSTPSADITEIVYKIKKEGCELAGVPGFYRTSSDVWKFMGNQRGIFIPVRDCQGRIQGMQVRKDQIKKRKFRWVSSGEMNAGCKAEGWTHLAGRPAEKILLTEGPMKADVIHALSGDTVLAVPGVNALTQLEKTLRQLQEMGLRKVMTAFDMDMFSNPHVQKGYQNLLGLLDRLELSFGSYTWDSRYKGLDDYIWEYCLGKKRLQKKAGG